jgi:spore maturation protein CgeB
MAQGMKMIYVGTLSKSPDRDSSWIEAFEKLGCEVIPFCTQPDVTNTSLVGRVCRRLNIGLSNWQMQQDLIKVAICEKPAWIHFRLPLEFNRKTIQTLKSKNIIVTQYFNDDPFSNRSPLGLHWKFRHALSAYDGHFVYRAHNVKRYLKAGVSQVEHCPPTYDPRRHFPATLPSTSSCFLADAAFVGHWEDDWRVECLDALVRNGYNVILKGGMWDKAIKGRQIGKLSPISHAFGEEYNHIYANVAAGLCFFSKINNDSWTERCLEIIAVGGVLVCERTEEAQSRFRDREEAYFFSSIRELIQIVENLKTDPQNREKVRAAGYARLLQSGNTINDRAEQVYKLVEKIKHGGAKV